MHAARCYQTSSEPSTIALRLLTEADCLNGLLNLTSFERHSLAAQQFKGALGDKALMFNHEGMACSVYVGAGNGQSEALAIASVATTLPGGSYLATPELTHEALVAWSLAQYQFDRYKECVSPQRGLVVEASLLHAVLAQADAVYLVRDLINTPTNDLGPQELADIVSTLALKHGALFQQWVGDELVQANFPAIHAVGRAAAAAPRLLSLVWGCEHHPRVTLVGKGVCFDSGGLDLKSSSNMRLMKKDMGGAAQVIGLAQWLMTHRVPIRLQVLIPAVENAVDAAAYRPGDVLTMRNGLTVEIDNTDAEGRLVLADAMVKACEDKPELLIDFATLTGAARVAVGTDIAAMFVNDDALALGLSKAASAVHDPVWRMPLFDGYESLFTSSIADMANSSASPYAGAITAALFLQRFISPGVSWAHFDVMAWNVGSRPGKPEGGEAMGIRAVGEYLRDRYRA